MSIPGEQNWLVSKHTLEWHKGLGDCIGEQIKFGFKLTQMLLLLSDQLSQGCRDISPAHLSCCIHEDGKGAICQVQSYFQTLHIQLNAPP